MADDNRPLKYARYAIGEIVLWVIITDLLDQNRELEQINKNILDLLQDAD